MAAFFRHTAAPEPSGFRFLDAQRRRIGILRQNNDGNWRNWVPYEGQSRRGCLHYALARVRRRKGGVRPEPSACRFGYYRYGGRCVCCHSAVRLFGVASVPIRRGRRSPAVLIHCLLAWLQQRVPRVLGDVRPQLGNLDRRDNAVVCCRMCARRVGPKLGARLASLGRVDDINGTGAWGSSSFAGPA